MATDANEDVIQLDFTTADGHQSCVYCPNPSVLPLPSEAPVVFFYPAMGTRGGYYHRLLRPMSEAGIRFVVLEQRGQGLSSIRPSPSVNYGYKELVELDMREAVKVVKASYPAASKILLCGHSLGGQMSVLFAAAFPEEVDGLFLVCSVSAYGRVYPSWSVWFSIQLAGLLFPIIAWVKGFHPGRQVGFGGKDAKGVIEDWSRQARTGKYIPHGSKIDYEKRIAEINMPVYGVVVKGDERAPAPALKHLIGKIYKTDSLIDQNLETVELDPKAMKVPHFAWVKDPSQIIERLGNFISKL